MSIQLFDIYKNYSQIENSHHLSAKLFSHTRKVISFLNNQKMITFILEKCYNYKKQIGQIDISKYNIDTLPFAEINKKYDCPFLIELYESQMFLKTCKATDLQILINKNIDKKYIFCPIKYYHYDNKHIYPEIDRHIGLLILDNETKICYYMNTNGWTIKNYDRIIEDTFDKFCKKINYSYIYQNVWNKNNININYGNKIEIGHCVPLSYLAIIYLNNNKSIYDYFIEISTSIEENKRKLLKEFENYLVSIFYE